MSSALHGLNGSNKTRPAAWAESTRKDWVVRSAQFFLCAWFIFYVVHALSAALWFNGAPADGPFEVFDPLRRIAAGQTPGKDFIQYHGIGVPFMHYPLFVLFGGKTLTASELSRQFTSIALFVFSLGMFAWVTLRRADQVWIAMAATVFLVEAVFPFEMRAASPGNSVVMVRSTIPIFAFTAMQLRLNPWLKAILVGWCVGLAFLFGTEHGLALTLGLIVAAAIAFSGILFGNKTSNRLALDTAKFAAMTLAAAVLFAAAFLLLLCGPTGAWNAIHYTLVELPADQFWFTTGPPLPYLSAWSQLVSDRHAIFCLLPVLATASLLGWMIVRFRNRSVPLADSWEALVTFMAAYGLLSCVAVLGSLSKHYLLPLSRIWCLVGMVLFVHRKDFPELGRSRLLTWKGWQSAPAVFVILCAAAGVALAGASSVSAFQLARHLRVDTPAYNRYLGQRWDSFMAQATALLDSQRQRPYMSLWSPYSDLLEAHYGIFLPVDDYIIHSSGAKRWPDYVAAFRTNEPEFVQTLTQDFDFEEWLQDGKWEFYEAVLDNYDPIRQVGHAQFWHRKNEPWRQPSTDFKEVTFDPKSHVVNLPLVSDGPDQIAVVRIQYHVVNPLKWFPLLGNTPRYLAIPEGTPRRLPVSLPPYGPQFQFPVQIPPGKQVKLQFETQSLLPDVTLVPDKIEVKILPWRPGLRSIYARETVGIIRPNTIPISR